MAGRAAALRASAALYRQLRGGAQSAMVMRSPYAARPLHEEVARPSAAEHKKREETLLSTFNI
jgi:hypothetical protein